MKDGYFEASVGRAAETPFVALPVASEAFPLHYHKEIEIYYVLEGSVDFTIGDDALTAFKGDIVVCMPWQCHSFVRHGDFMFIRTAVDLGGNCRNLSTLRLTDPVIHPAFVDYCELKDVLDSIINTPRDDPDRMFMLNSLANLLIYRMMKLLPLEVLTGEDLDGANERIAFVRRLEDYVSEFYGEELSLNDAARRFCLSTGYFARTFKRHMNTTFVAYLTSYRASRAAELLGKTNLSIEEIAERCGFVSYRNLNRAFSNLYGKSPSSFRKDLKSLGGGS